MFESGYFFQMGNHIHTHDNLINLFVKQKKKSCFVIRSTFLLLDKIVAIVIKLINSNKKKSVIKILNSVIESVWNASLILVDKYVETNILNVWH